MLSDLFTFLSTIYSLCDSNYDDGDDFGTFWFTNQQRWVICRNLKPPIRDWQWSGNDVGDEDEGENDYDEEEDMIHTGFTLDLKTGAVLTCKLFSANSS